MKKATCFLVSTIFLLLGIIIGFIIAPIKKGVYCGNNNGNTYSTKKPFEIQETPDGRVKYVYNPKAKND